MTNELANLMTSAQAAAYISERLPKPWADPVSSLGYLVMQDLISPVDLPGKTTGDRVEGLGSENPVPYTPNPSRVPARYFERSECDRFIASYRRPGNRPKDLSAILDRLGREPDTVLAKEMGVSVRTIARKRKELGIPVYKPHY